MENIRMALGDISDVSGLFTGYINKLSSSKEKEFLVYVQIDLFRILLSNKFFPGIPLSIQFYPTIQLKMTIIILSRLNFRKLGFFSID